MTLATRVLEAPAADSGVSTGDDDWWITVEVLLPAEHTSVVGVAVVGTDVVSSDVWTDLTDYVTGVSIRDGASDWGNHRTPSTCNITLRSPDHRFATWQPYGTESSGARFRFGCLIRVCLHDPVADEWHPLFTGEIESCEERSAGVDAVIIADVVAVDTVSARLARAQLVDFLIDPDDTKTELIADTLADLLEYANWPYGDVIDLPVDDDGDDYEVLGRMYTSGNVLAQLRRIGDAVGRTVAADRYGRVAFVRRAPQLVTYSNAYTPATDPNAPDPVTIDTATDTLADTVLPVDAQAAVINAVEIVKLWSPGIYGPAIIGDGAMAPARKVAGQLQSVRYGLQFATVEAPYSTRIPTDDHPGWHTATADDLDSQARYGLRKLAMSDMFPIYYGLFVGEQLADRLVELQSDDLWIVPVGLDNRAIDIIAAARVGAATTVDHDGATFTGYLAGINIDSIPMQGRCRITADLTVHAYELERSTT